MPLSLPLPLLRKKDEVRDRVPSIMYADEEEQQRRRADKEECHARIEVNRVCRSG
jgi:hypothetical protein